MAYSTRNGGSYTPSSTHSSPPSASSSRVDLRMTSPNLLLLNDELGTTISSGGGGSGNSSTDTLVRRRRQASAQTPSPSDTSPGLGLGTASSRHPLARGISSGSRHLNRQGSTSDGVDDTADVSRPTLKRLTSEVEREVAAAGEASRSSMDESSLGGGSLRGSFDLLRGANQVKAEVEVLVHDVKPTDSLAGIALTYGTDLALLRRANKLWPTDPLTFRRTIHIPLDSCRWNKSAFTGIIRGPEEGQVTLIERDKEPIEILRNGTGYVNGKGKGVDRGGLSLAPARGLGVGLKQGQGVAEMFLSSTNASYQTTEPPQGSMSVALSSPSYYTEPGTPWGFDDHRDSDDVSSSSSSTYQLGPIYDPQPPPPPPPPPPDSRQRVMSTLTLPASELSFFSKPKEQGSSLARKSFDTYASSPSSKDRSRSVSGSVLPGMARSASSSSSLSSRAVDAVPPVPPLPKGFGPSPVRKPFKTTVGMTPAIRAFPPSSKRDAEPVWHRRASTDPQHGQDDTKASRIVSDMTGKLSSLLLSPTPSSGAMPNGRISFESAGRLSPMEGSRSGRDWNRAPNAGGFASSELSQPPLELTDRKTKRSGGEVGGAWFSGVGSGNADPGVKTEQPKTGPKMVIPGQDQGKKQELEGDLIPPWN